MDGSALPLTLARSAPATRERICDAAEALFMEHGFEATSLRAITAAAAVGTPPVGAPFAPRTLGVDAARSGRRCVLTRRHLYSR